MREFRCPLCTRLICDVSGSWTEDICALCWHVEDWYNDPHMRLTVDPDGAKVDAFYVTELHMPGHGHFPVSELATRQELRIALDENGEGGMWALAQLRAMQK